MSGRTAKTSRRNLLAAAAVALGAIKAGTTTAAAHSRHRHPGHGVQCLLGGTRIQTPTGLRNVAELRIGELVLTPSGEAKPIRWIGRRRLTRGQPGWTANVMPVVIRKNAIADGVPSNDVLVSAGHALYLDGHLIQAGALVNGQTIVQEVDGTRDVLDYFQVELADHDVILAEGLPVESFPGAMDHSLFDNAAEYHALFGVAALVGAVPFAAEIGPGSVRGQLASRLRSAAAPLVDRRRPFDRVRDRIEDRAEAMAGAA